jgi:nucleosome binding factor SPN SPT16 subunit
MLTNEKKGITVKIDADLHAEVRQFLENHSMTMAEFVTLALQDELHPKLNIMEDRNMGNMRTLAFQVPEELFHKIKDYLQRNNLTQKEFVIGLIETEIERDLTQRAVVGEGQAESAAVSDCESASEEVDEQPDERESADFSDDFDGESEESENPDEDEDESENLDVSEDMEMSMSM